MTCQCDICLNLGLKTKALIAVGVKGLSQSITSNLRQTLCAVPGKEKEKMDMSEFNLSCMTRKCPYCGVHHLREILHELNPDLQEEEDDRLVVYHAWERKEMEFHIVNHKVRHQKPDGVDSVPVKRKILDRVPHTVTVTELVNTFLDDIKEMSIHQFNIKHQRNVFNEWISKQSDVDHGCVVMVEDFSTNFTHI